MLEYAGGLVLLARKRQPIYPFGFLDRAILSELLPAEFLSEWHVAFGRGDDHRLAGCKEAGGGSLGHLFFDSALVLEVSHELVPQA